MSLQNNPLQVSELVDLAYDIAKSQFGNQFFSFTSIWSKVWKSSSNFSKEKVENWIGYFYTELLTDPRFVVFSFNNWRLKEFMNFDEVKKLDKTVFYDDSVLDDYVFEESYLKEKSDQEVEIAPESNMEDDMGEESEEEKDSESSEESDELFEEEV